MEYSPRKAAESIKRVLSLNIQTQTIETAFLSMNSIQIVPKLLTNELKLSHVGHNTDENGIPSDLQILSEAKKKDKKYNSRKNIYESKFNNQSFKSDDEDGYKINNQMNEFKYKMMRRRSLKTEQDQEEEELDTYIKFFEKAIDENNYEIIENMEMLYSCTAHYVSSHFSFQNFEKQHDRTLHMNLRKNKPYFPDFFTRFID